MKTLFENVINPYQILGILIALRILQKWDGTEYPLKMIIWAIIAGILIVVPYEFNKNGNN